MADLSPLARGTPEATDADSVGKRFIPAGAGNTDRHFAVIVYSAIYPRWRGEHTKHT